MKKCITPAMALMIALTLAGCANQNRPKYVWNDYSSSLYAVKKAPSDAALKSHCDLLLSIIEESKQKNLRVPPGVYCEYGYILLKQGKKEEALAYLDLEEQTYPESRVFIQNLKRNQKKEIAKADDGDAAEMDVSEGDSGGKDDKAQGDK